MNTQRGNALFLILIAVALFAALSYAITHSDRGGSTISREQALIDAGVEQDCTARVEQAVLRLKTLYGCTDTTISYELPDGSNANPDAPADKSCNIFDPAGAGESPCNYVSGSSCSESSAAPGELISGGSCNGLVYVSNNLGSRLYTTPADQGVANRSDAQSACSNLGTGWRLPTKDELHELYLAKHTGVLNNTFNETGSMRDGFYWSSTPYDSDNTWYQRFSDPDYANYQDGLAQYLLSFRCVQ